MPNFLCPWKDLHCFLSVLLLLHVFCEVVFWIPDAFVSFHVNSLWLINSTYTLDQLIRVEWTSFPSCVYCCVLQGVEYLQRRNLWLHIAEIWQMMQNHKEEIATTQLVPNLCLHSSWKEKHGGKTLWIYNPHILNFNISRGSYFVVIYQDICVSYVSVYFLFVSIDACREDWSFGRLVNDDQRHPNCKMKEICLFALKTLKKAKNLLMIMEVKTALGEQLYSTQYAEWLVKLQNVSLKLDHNLSEIYKCSSSLLNTEMLLIRAKTEHNLKKSDWPQYWSDLRLQSIIYV